MCLEIAFARLMYPMCVNPIIQIKGETIELGGGGLMEIRYGMNYVEARFLHKYNS